MKKLTEKEIFDYEKAFEDGYRTAVRIYKPSKISVELENESGLVTYRTRKTL